MTALSSDKRTERTEGVEVSVPVKGSTTIYAGAMVSVGADGYAVPASDATGQIFMGIALEHVDNSSGSDGDKSVVVRRAGLVKISAGSTISQANVGDKVYAVDDQTVDIAANTTNDILVGKIAAFSSSSAAWIDIGAGVLA